MFANLHRKKFVSGRAPRSDEEFASRVGARPELHRLVAAAREALARVCHLPAPLIYPEDAPASIAQMVGDWDDLAVALELESALGITVDEQFPHFLGWRFFWRGEAGPHTVGEWAIRVSEYLESRLHDNHVG